MRVLHILDHSLPLQSGYTFRTRAIMSAQIARGWQVLGVTGARHKHPGPAFETVDGLDFHRAGTLPPKPSPFSEITEIQHLAAKISELTEEFRPDLLHAHSPVLGALAGLKVARRKDLPLLYEIRAFWEDAAVGNGTGREGSIKYRLTKAIETWAIKRADAVAVICEGLRKDLIARGLPQGKIMVSPNGVDLTLFGNPPARDAQLARELGLNPGCVIGYIGSFYDYEGLDDLIAAMPALVAANPSARLLLVGGGPREADLRAQAAASPAGGAIRFVGRVAHDQVDRYYSLVDILAYPRKKMRLTDLVTPLKPLEAMAQMKLVAASDIGGHRELIEDGKTGTLFPPDNPQAMAQALSSLLADRANWEIRRKTARAFVEKERNWASNISRYDGVYQALTGLPVS